MLQYNLYKLLPIQLLLVITFLPATMIQSFSFHPRVLTRTMRKVPSRMIPLENRVQSLVRRIQTTSPLQLEFHVDSFGVKTASVLPEIPANAHRMVLMRHGESEFNNANIFTGWCDVALTRRGMETNERAKATNECHSSSTFPPLSP